MNDISDLDNCLLQTVNFLISNWYNENTGIVACALKDGDKVAFATSSRNGKNWLHAERNAYKKFNQLYGEPGKNAKFVITLSPCSEKLKYRAEESCAEFIKKIGINRIHFGILDTIHASSISTYSKIGFITSITQNEILAAICKNLMDLFAKYDSRINSELLKIKQELGDSFFTIYPRDGKVKNQ